MPSLSEEIDALFEQYARERLRRPDETEAPLEDTELSSERERMDRRDDLEEDDEGGAESFFAWFFRGKGPSGVLSGAAFQKHRLSSTSSAYATLFEDNYVASLLGVGAGEVVESLGRAIGEPPETCEKRLRGLAFGFFRERSRQREGYPRLYVFEGYQVAGLVLLRERGGRIGEQAGTILAERFSDIRHEALKPPTGFPGPEVGLNLKTVFTELRCRPALRKQLWPKPVRKDFRTSFRQREQRRELLSTMARLGAAYVDLYLLAIEQVGSFLIGQRMATESAADLARNFVELLEKQQGEAGFHAFHELSQAAEAFDYIVAVNFPEVPLRPLPELARHYAATLQKQVPVGRMSGGVNQRLVRQFRMPGFPLILITTDVLQEGEDLHTFCRRVVHYGIAWTPSAIEQRTGRVDRIGGLVQRRLDGSPTPPKDEELIQVYYPHLRDTVELLQVRRVLRRLNRFMQLIHLGARTKGADEHGVDASRAWLDELEDPPPITGKLKSAFPIKPGWLEGELGAQDVTLPDWERYFRHLEALWQGLCKHYPIAVSASSARHLCRGEIRAGAVKTIGGGSADPAANGRMQPFTLSLRSQVAGDEILLECESMIGFVDLEHDAVVDALMEAVSGDRLVKLCVEPRVGRHQDRIYVRREILFDPDATRLVDVLAMFENTLSPAARLHAVLQRIELLGTRAD